MAIISVAAPSGALRKLWRNMKALASADLAAEVRAINARLDTANGRLDTLHDARAIADADFMTELRGINSRLDALDYHSHGARAVYIGKSRVLMKAVVANALIAFLLEADDRLLTPWFVVSGRYETELTDFFLRHLKPDSHFIDVGSNFGYYTCLMARFCPSGRAFAIEADAHVCALTRDNIVINGFSHIAEAVHAAASDGNDRMTLYRRLTRSANTSLAKMPDDFVARLGEPPSEPFEVPGIRIDDLLSRMDGRVDFIKIDVEGAEPLVLRGARETVKRNDHLTIVMEWSPGQIQAAGFDLNVFLSELEDMQLRFFDTGGKTLSRSDLLASGYFTGIVLRRG
jgi:FkbM family methyltransferase